MKIFFVLLISILLVPFSSNAAIPSNAIWEVRATNGSDTNGGGFVAAITSISTKTDLVVSAVNNSQVSSSSYGFTSADVGRYLKVTSGTGWTPGVYQVISVTGGIATLDHSPANLSTTGGNFIMYYGIDYSQKNSKNSSGINISTTDLVSAGTTTLVSATAAFTNDIIGNIVYISGGSGSIVGNWYEVTGYTNSTTITVDRSTGLTIGSGATLNIGGALQTIGKAGSIEVSGNVAFVKAEANYSISSGITLNGKAVGYNTTRRDGGMATIIDASTSSITLVTASSLFANFYINCNGQLSTTGISAGAMTSNIKVTGCGTSSFYTPSTGPYIVINSEFTGETAGHSVVMNSGGNSTLFLINTYIHDGIGEGIYSGGWHISGS